MGHEVDQAKEGRIYFLVWAALMALTVVTVWVSFIDFGSTGDVVVGMAIACVKASLVALFFMHLKHENGVIWMYAIYPIVLVALLMFGTVGDDMLRKPMMNPLPDGQIIKVSPEH